METGVQHGAARLCDFIREQRDCIIAEWTRRIRSLPVANELSQPRLIDHLPDLLDRISDVMSSPHDGGAPTLNALPKLHALDRLDRGFDLKAVVSEYAVLRRCILDLYCDRHGDRIHAPEFAKLGEAIDQAIRESAEHYEKQRLRVLAGVDRLTTSSPAGLPLHELLERLLDVFVGASEAVDTSSILLLEDGQLRLRASNGLADDVRHRWAVPLGKGFAGTIAATRQPLELRHASEDPLLMSPYLRRAGLRALYGVPLLFNDELLGVAHMASRTAFEFSEDDRALFRVLTTRAAVFIYENLLRSNAERRAAELEATIDAIPGEVMIASRNDGITSANAAALAMLGISSIAELRRADRVGERLNLRDADSDRTLAEEELPFVRAMRGQSARRDLRIHHLGRDADVVVRTVAAPIRLHEEIVGAVCVCLDISDRKALEKERERLLQAVDEERERLLETLRQVPAGVVIVDAETGQIVLSNEAADAIWRAPIRGRTIGTYAPGELSWPDGRKMAERDYPLARALRGESVHQEVRIRRGDGTWGTVLSSSAPVRRADGRIFAAVVAFIDITERKTAEEQFRAVADNMPQLAWIADGSGAIGWYNRRWLEYTGTTLDDVKGWGWRSVHHPDCVDRVEQKFRQHLATGEAWEDTFPLRGKDGRYRWFLSRAIPIRDDSGRVVHWFGTNTDITEHRRLAEAREQFVAILGHDLRSPLGAIVMSAHLLAGKVADQSLAAIVRRISASGQRMQMMISDLLDFTRGRLGGGIPIEPKPADLRAVCRSVVDEIAAAHPQTKIALDVEGDPAGTWDAARLAQVVQNLVINAIEHGDARAGVGVVVDGRAPDAVRLRVTNRGPTIPTELLPHLFDPFRRLASGGDAGRSSLGLGLFIVSEIAGAHGGNVVARSSAEEGTLFEVRLPRVSAPQA